MKLVLTLLFVSLSQGLHASGDHDHGAQEEHKHGSEKQTHDDHSDHVEESGHGEHGHGDENGHEGEHEEKITITDVGMGVSGINIQVAGPQTITRIVAVTGEIALNKDRVAHISPRFPGVVKTVHVKLGQRIKKGQTLAVVEANGSETNYSLKSRMNGTVIKQQLVRGQFIPTGHNAFQIADLSDVWLQLKVPEKYALAVQKGQSITLLDGSKKVAEAKIDYLAAVMHEDSQSRLVRAVLDNKSNQWRPGQFVKAKIKLGETVVSLAVTQDAIQSMNNRPVVFEEVETNTFQPREVSLGIKNSEWAEVTSGISKGMRYAATSSYILKADLMKSEAEHEH